MDSIFNIGGAELLLILLLAGIVMGPKRIQTVAYWLGRMMVQLRGVQHKFIRLLNAELAAVDGDGDLKTSVDEIKELHRQINDLKKDVSSMMMLPANEMKSMMEETRQITNSIMPPNMGMDAEKKDDADDKGDDADETDIIIPSPPLTLPSLIDIADDPE